MIQIWSIQIKPIILHIQTLKVDYMANIEVTAGTYGITFNLPTAKYVVGWWQIEQYGFTSWHNQLRDKNWFSDEVSRRFSDLCIEHYNWN